MLSLEEHLKPSGSPCTGCRCLQTPITNICITQVMLHSVIMHDIHQDFILNLAGPCTEGFLPSTPQSPPGTSSYTCRHTSYINLLLLCVTGVMMRELLTYGTAVRYRLKDAGLLWKTLRERGRTPPVCVWIRPERR